MAACSVTPSPQLPLGVAQDLRNHFVVDPSDYLAEARAADAALDYALCLDKLQRFALAEPEQCDASFWQWQARVAENAGNNTQVVLNAQLKWLTFTPNDVWLRIDIADSYSRLQRLEDGLLMLAYPIEDIDEQKTLNDARVFLIEHNGFPKRAADLCMELAEQSDPQQARLYYQKASMLYEEAGDLALATEAISKALTDEALSELNSDELLRLRAFELGEPKNVSDARKLLYMHSDAEFRLIGIRYMMRGFYQGDLQDYIFALDDESVSVLETAISQVAIRGSAAELLLLEEFLAHPHRKIKLAAIRAYESLGIASDAAIIVPIVDIDDRELFRAWRLCLERMTNYSIGLELDPDYDTRLSIVELWQEYLIKQ
jgi:tetratricopeptide (TPR) repeat protein